ncbi:hypothetical protein GCM10010960_05140 [Arenimonas maotaiensis]|uniref:EF-hand domain-containing protein n=1 Tax=Arenimonas maotaiensis TaxID=1446479 RepID=A0A917CFU0_9GAMM|nr:EF-hand domain-containing protein [Arenimonas maotaiensis]GGF86083.1 hypothetical protein GCM10010960_05140 [Arenimonas maotaiensis]
MNTTRYLIPLLLALAGGASAQTKPATPAVPASAKPAAAKPAPGANLDQGIDKMFAALDTDNNKQLSFDEFKRGVVAERRQAMLLQQLGQLFKAGDKSGNGTLEAVEFNALPGVKAAKEPKPKFADFDLNKDQKLDFREYVQFVGRMSAPAKK